MHSSSQGTALYSYCIVNNERFKVVELLAGRSVRSVTNSVLFVYTKWYRALYRQIAFPCSIQNLRYRIFSVELINLQHLLILFPCLVTFSFVAHIRLWTQDVFISSLLCDVITAGSGARSEIVFISKLHLENKSVVVLMLTFPLCPTDSPTERYLISTPI